MSMKSQEEIQTAIDNAEQTLSFTKEVGGIDDSIVEKFTLRMIYYALVVKYVR